MVEKTVGLTPVKTPADDFNQFHEQKTRKKTTERGQKQRNENFVHNGLPVERGKTGMYHGGTDESADQRV